MDILTEFFRTIPALFTSLWNFGNGFEGLAITVGSIVLTAGFLFAAQRTRDDYGWISATFGGCAAMIAGLWAFGILPSAWVYYMDGAKDVLTDTMVPSQIAIGEFVVFGNFYEVFRDSIVMVETTVAMVGFTAFALWVQKKYPRVLADGEEAGDKTGGYK
jgi:nucleoside permease NupC